MPPNYIAVLDSLSGAVLIEAVAYFIKLPSSMSSCSPENTFPGKASKSFLLVFVRRMSLPANAALSWMAKSRLVAGIAPHPSPAADRPPGKIRYQNPTELLAAAKISYDRQGERFGGLGGIPWDGYC